MMTREEYDDVYRWCLRPTFWNWNTKEGYQKPLFGRQVTRVCVSLYLGIVCLRFRLWKDKRNLPRKVFVWSHPPIYKWHPYFDVDIKNVREIEDGQ